MNWTVYKCSTWLITLFEFRWNQGCSNITSFWKRRCFWAIKRRLQSVRSNLPGHITVFHAGFDKEQIAYSLHFKGEGRLFHSYMYQHLPANNCKGYVCTKGIQSIRCHFQRTASCFSNVILVTIPIWIILEPSIFSYCLKWNSIAHI